MPKFTFVCDHNDELGSGPKVTLETERLFLDDVLFDIQDFLKGAGFVFDGELCIVSTGELYGREVEQTADESECCGGCGGCEGPKVFESPDKGQTVYARPHGESWPREQVR